VNRCCLQRVVIAGTLCLAPLITSSATELPLRVVPQFGWAKQGIASPDGALFVSGMGDYGAHSLRLVSKEGVLLWTIPLSQPADAAFSPDGKWLAACGADEGLLLDLKNCRLRYFRAFRGLLMAFTPDGQKLLFVRRAAARKESGDYGLFVFDLEAQQTARLPVEMSVPQTMEVLADGKTVRIHGAHGNPGMHVPRMGKADETLHLDTGKTERNWGPIERGWVAHSKDPRLVAMPDATHQRRTGGPQEFYWNETSGICLLSTFALWDIRGGRFLRDVRQLNLSEVGGWLDGDTLLATSWKDGKSSLSLVNMRSPDVSDTGLPPHRALPAPAGKSMFCYTDRSDPYAARLELRQLPSGTPVYRETTDLFAWESATWSRDGQYLACLGPQKSGPAMKLFAAADGKVVSIPLADVVASHTKNPDEPPHIWRLAVDDTGEHVAVGMGWTNYGLFAIVGRQSGKAEMVVDGFPYMVQALHFIGQDRLLTATGNGRVQLWDLRRRQPMWTTETDSEPLQFGYVPGGRYTVCTNLARRGTVLRIEDGKVVYKSSPLRSSDSSVVLPWTQPQLVGRGDWALECDPESMQVRLLDLAAGTTALTYCTLPEGQWIVYTPDGDWDGSERALQWVKFCRGLKLVPQAKAESHRTRERIDAVLHRAFNTHFPPASRQSRQSP
jgi:WD40 repeat protein